MDQGAEPNASVRRYRDAGWSMDEAEAADPAEVAAGLPTVGEHVRLQAGPLAGLPGAVVPCQISGLSTPFIALFPVGPTPLLRPGVPVMLTCAAGPRTVDLEGLVADLWNTGHINVRLTSVPVRRHRRHRVSVPVQLQWLSGGQPTLVSGFTMDVSAGGVKVRLREELRVGDRLFVTLSLPRRAPLEAIAKVVREPAADAEGWYQVGLQFSTVSEDHRARLASYLNREATLDG